MASPARRRITLPDGTQLWTAARYAEEAESADWDGKCCAERKRGGGRCRGPAMTGQVVCRLHGGQSEQALEKAAERVRVREARSQLGKLGIPVDGTDTVQAVQVALDAAHGQLVGAAALLATADEGDAMLPVYVELHDRAIDRLAKVGKAAADMGIAERRTQLAEAQAVMLAGALREIVERLGLTAEQRERFPTVAREVLSQLPAGPVVEAEVVEP